MSNAIAQDLAASGVAAVIVVLKPTAIPTATAAAASARSLARYFTESDLSHEAAVVSDALRRAAATGDPLRSMVVPAVGGALRAAAANLNLDAAATSLLRRAGRLLARPAVLRVSHPEAIPPPRVRYYPNLGVALGTVDRASLAALQADPQVDEVQGAPRIGLIHPTEVVPGALRSRLTWGIGALGISALWEAGLSGKGILVGHLDTGVDGSHPALTDAVAHFAEFDDLGRQVLPDPAPHDTGQHGTHTAGTIAGRPQSGRSIGLAPGASLASGVVIEGGQVVARVLGGMDWAVGRGVRVLSMSLGLQGYWTEFEPIVRILRGRGILPVFAVGNEGPGTSRSPGNYAQALSVGAIDRGGAVGWFSSSQRFLRTADPLVPDLVAPGAHVISAKPGGGYQSMAGTSMAAPHVAGLAALLLEARPDATPDELEAAIFGSCTVPEEDTVDRVNRGIPSAPRALELLIGGSP